MTPARLTPSTGVYPGARDAPVIAHRLAVTELSLTLRATAWAGCAMAGKIDYGRCPGVPAVRGNTEASRS
jgi:hypothetical protein